MPTVECQSCGNPVEPPYALCKPCRRDYAQTLHMLRGNMMLTQRLARHQYRRGDPANGPKPHGGSMPAPVNLHLLDLLDQTEDTLQDIWIDAGGIWLDRWQKLIPRMQTHLAQLCKAPHAGDGLRKLQHANRLLAAVNGSQPRARRIIGPCPNCGREIQAASTEKYRLCECGRLIDLAELRAQTAVIADQYHLTNTPAGLSEWLRENYGYRISRQNIKDWLRRGKLPSSKPVPDNPGYWEFSLREVLANAMAFSKRQ